MRSISGKSSKLTDLNLRGNDVRDKHLAESENKEKKMKKTLFLIGMLIFICWNTAFSEPPEVTAETDHPSAQHSTAAGETTLYLTSGEWPPYYGEKLPHYGSDSHIVTQAFAIAGVKVVYKFYPWARALYMSQTGKCDGGVGWGDGDEYRKDHYVSETTSMYSLVFFHRKDYPFDWKTFNDIKNLRVGLTIAYDYPEQLKTMETEGKIKAEWVSRDELNFRKLFAGRIDIFPNDALVGISQMKQIFTPEQTAQITYHNTALKKGTLHLILSKKKERNARLIKLFDEGLQGLKRNGTYDAILQAAQRGEYNPE